jgi:hypothetical protein
LEFGSTPILSDESQGLPFELPAWLDQIQIPGKKWQDLSQ